MSYRNLVVIAKEPLPGKAKTRLAAGVGPDAAAALARAALADTFTAAEAVSDVQHRVVAIDGDGTSWVPSGWQQLPQCDGGLDRRLSEVFRRLPGSSFLVGMDTPQLTPTLLSEFDPARYDVAIGPASDGGFWGIGFADGGDAHRIVGVPMSTAYTFSVQLHALDGLRVQLLPELDDVDTVDDARRVAALAPCSRFARTLRQVA